MQQYQKPEKAQKKIPAAFFIVLLLAVLAAALLWIQNARTTQSVRSISMKIGFDGEYRIGEGAWQPVVDGVHISSTQGDVTLRGTFFFRNPDSGEFLAPVGKGLCIALYLNHISCSIQERGETLHICDAENPLIGSGTCGQIWSSYELRGESGAPITILLHNPHRFGNENAVDDFLNSLAGYGGSAFERQKEVEGAFQRGLGFVFVLSAFAVFGTALFSAALRLRQSRLFWQIGCLFFFAGGYFVFSAPNVSFWNWSIVNNTTILGICMMFYMLSLLWLASDHLGDQTKKMGEYVLIASCVICGALLLHPMISDISFYDTWLPWAVAQSAGCLLMIICMIREAVKTEWKQRLTGLCNTLPMLAFLLDVAATGFGWWQGGVASKLIFILLYASVMVHALRNIPRNILSAAKAEQLEVELQKSRIAIMMSQIRPHFIYNTLGSIEALCTVQPEAAASLVHNFARYLRGNLGELDNPAPIRMSQEMEHVRCYVDIEKIRFPDITVEFRIQSEDFLLPALSVQPLVENAIKHGLMQLPEGGTVTVSTFETETHNCICVEDNGGGFDTAHLWEDGKHVGLRNIRERLETMCGGTLMVQSKPGSGTKVTIQIPKEERI